MSSDTPIAARKVFAAEDFENFSTSSVTISGSSISSSNLCPLPRTRFVDPVAAMAESSATRRSFLFIDLAVRFEMTGGKAIRPPIVPGAKAAVPESGPCPPTRGTLEIPLPTPKDSAVVRFPAIGLRPCGWNR